MALKAHIGRRARYRLGKWRLDLGARYGLDVGVERRVDDRVWIRLIAAR
jgi:hypothetical protein